MALKEENKEDPPFQVVELWHKGGRVNGDQEYLDTAYNLLNETSSLDDLKGNGSWTEAPESKAANQKVKEIPKDRLITVEF